MTRLADELLRGALAETPEIAPLHCVAENIVVKPHLIGSRQKLRPHLGRRVRRRFDVHLQLDLEFLALGKPAGELRWCADVEEVELRAALEERLLDAGLPASGLRFRLERKSPELQLCRGS